MPECDDAAVPDLRWVMDREDPRLLSLVCAFVGLNTLMFIAYTWGRRDALPLWWTGPLCGVSLVQSVYYLRKHRMRRRGAQ